MLHRRNVKKPRISVSTVTTVYNEQEIRKWKRYWRRRGIKASASACENRGGNIDKESGLFPYGFASKIGCRRPSVNAVVCYNGDVVLCCVDWWRTEVMGNLKEQSLQEIWTSQRMQEIRRGHAEQDASVLPQICSDCGVSYYRSRQHFSLKGLCDRLKIFLGQDQRTGLTRATNDDRSNENR